MAILKESESRIAIGAKQPANFAGAVAVVYAGSPFFQSFLAYSATFFLFYIQRIELVYGHSVFANTSLLSKITFVPICTANDSYPLAQKGVGLHPLVVSLSGRLTTFRFSIIPCRLFTSGRHIWTVAICFLADTYATATVATQAVNSAVRVIILSGLFLYLTVRAHFLFETFIRAYATIDTMFVPLPVTTIFAAIPSLLRPIFMSPVICKGFRAFADRANAVGYTIFRHGLGLLYRLSLGLVPVESSGFTGTAILAW